MQRRHFLSGGLSLPLWAQSRGLKIEAVEIWEFTGTREAEKGVNGQYQVQPLHIYDNLRPPEYRDGAAVKGPQKTTALYLRLRASGGAEGLYGPIDRETVTVIGQQLRPFLIGKDAMAGDALWDQLWRLNRHGRAGHFLMAVSAVDNAVWDLRGRVLGQPVYRLLGGPSRETVEVYGSALGSTLEQGRLAERARELFALGFRNQKWFLADGPGSGPAGMTRNVKVVETLRDALGPEAGLMFDVFNGWDLSYAQEWCRRVEHLGVRWLEEPFSSDKLEAYQRLSQSTRIPIATGEHFYGRWEVNRFLRNDAIRVVQADPEWCGGASELKKICSVGSLYDVPVIPHGHNLHAALHVVASEPPTVCPLGEYLVLKMNSYYFFDRHALSPKAGRVNLGDRPGFGMEIADERVESRKNLLASL